MKSIHNKRFVFRLMLLIFCAGLFALNINAQENNIQSKTFQFDNGKWFDGKGFRQKVFYSVNGKLTDKKPAKIDESIDLKNEYVIPPFADAHCHHFDAAYNVAQQVKMYLQNGVFYAKVQTDVRSGALQVANKVNIPSSVDVSYAHGALTHTYGHGIEIYEALALGIYGDLNVYKANAAKIAASRLRENDAYYIIDNAEELETKWPKILNGKPDFIKIYLLSSEDYEEKNRNIGKIRLGSIGLNPNLASSIVEKAHQAGLRVSAHVDTAVDFRIALRAGVDEMAHMPGYYIELDDKSEKYLLTAADAREAARRKIWVVPAPIFYGAIEPKIREKTDEVLKQNLRLLKKYKVNIAFGSDSYGRTPVEDVLYISKFGVFNNLQLLKIWSEDTPRTIFPQRKTGKLRNNYEASFITLKKNPLEDFENIKTVSYRFKQGFPIQP